MHLKIIHITLYSPELVKSYRVNPCMARAPKDHSFNPLPTENILKVHKLTHSWPMHINLSFNLLQPRICYGLFDQPIHGQSTLMLFIYPFATHN